MNHCETCKWWIGRPYNDGQRDCKKLTEGLVSDSGFLSCTTGDETHPFVTTKSNFGCVLWKLNGGGE